MSINFTAEQWDRVKKNYELWWEGKLDRPLVSCVRYGTRKPIRPKPRAPYLNQATCADFSFSAEELIDQIDYDLSQREFYGDAYPSVDMGCFGPGVIAAFMGGILDNSSGRVWFHPPKDELRIEDIHFKFDPDNKWFRRVRDIYAAGMERWQGQVLMPMTDLGGNLDILSSFRPSEKLLLDLYDAPDEVKRITWEAHEAWHSYYNAINEVLQPLNPGYSDWNGILSQKPSYILQCDFSYMIGPDMFKEFVIDEIKATCKRLSRTIYHLDGVGQLPHLDMLLETPGLGGIQWVPGAGKPHQGEWPELQKKVIAAGKKITAAGDLTVLDAIIAQVGTMKGIHFLLCDNAITDEKSANALLAEYGIDF